MANQALMWLKVRRFNAANVLLCVAGAAGALIFPPFAGAFAGYAALICFLVYFLQHQGGAKRLFLTAYGFGFCFYAVSFSWINNALLIDENRFVAFVPVVFVATGVFFGLFWAIPAAVAAWGRTIYTRVLFFSAAFVFMEWVRSFIFTGFPWNLLGTALSFNVRLIQGAADVGTYGLSLFLLLFFCGAAMFVVSVLKKRLLKGALWFVLLPMLFFFGEAMRYQPVQTENGMTVRLVQPNIPQTLKWQPELLADNFRQYIALSRETPLDKVRLVVWGEAACPYFLDRDADKLSEITAAVPEGGFLMTGLLRTGFDGRQIVPYNSLFVLDKNGRIRDYYDKAHLVPFGEYLPFRRYLPDFMAPVANVVGDLGRGEQYKNIRVDGLPLMGGAICYESIFPKEVLNPDERPEILAVLANDGWYGISAGPYQHLAASQMRAVEEGVSVIRSANTGISAVIAPNGDILGKIGLDKKGSLDVRLPENLSRQTLYGRLGNTVVFILLAFCVLLGIILNSTRDCF